MLKKEHNISNNTFLFSVDLEDVRENVVNGYKYKDSVEANTLLYINWLKKHNAKCTFFVVGKIAERYPDLIKTLIDQGHEIACHSHRHITINKFSKQEFQDDIEKNLTALYKAGASEISGYRAPVFSITNNTSWAHEILVKNNFKYSSSVLPAKNPLFGWPEFGAAPKKVDNLIWEFPISLSDNWKLNVPIFGGVYFRVLPYFLIKNNLARTLNSRQPILSYFHPYDVDVYQEKFMHDGINNNKFFNFLMYYNRKNVFKRLDKLVSSFDLKIDTYSNYIKKIDHGF